MRMTAFIPAVALALALAACGEAEQSSPAAAMATASDAAAVTAQIDPDAGERLYKRTCFVCHDTGAGGAPKRGVAADWSKRLPQGEATLLQSTLQGKGGMPPRGNSGSQTPDEEIAAAVHYLLASVSPEAN